MNCVWCVHCYIVRLLYLSMVEQATFLRLKVEFENMVMSMLIINPVIETKPFNFNMIAGARARGERGEAKKDLG